MPYLHSFPTRRSSDLTFVGEASTGYGESEDSVNVPSPFPKRTRTSFPKKKVETTRSTFPSPSRSAAARRNGNSPIRSEEHTSELQSRGHLVCRLLLEK